MGGEAAMTTKPRRTPAAARQAAHLVAALAALASLRVSLLTADCPPAIPQGERDAAVQDVSRCAAQLENLMRWYGAAVKRTARRR